MAERSLRVRLGLFVATALAVLAGLVVLFGGSPTFFTNRAKYTVLFPEAPGVAAGTPVRKSGVRVGEVTKIDLDADTGQVRVGVEVDKKFLPRTGEEPTISRGLLSGDTTLDFVPKTGPDGEPAARGDAYPAGAEIPGVAPVTARRLLSQASGVLPSAQDSMQQIVQAAQRFERAIPKFEKTADEFAALARAAREFVPELRQTNARVQDLIGSADPAPARPRSPAGRPADLKVSAQLPQPPADPTARQATLRDVLQELRDVLQGFRPAADDIGRLTRETGPELNRTLRSVKETSDRLADLLNPENRKNAAATLRNLQVASDDLTRTVRLVGLLADQAEKTLREFNARAVQAERVLTNLEKATAPVAANADQIVRDVSTTARNLSVASADLSRTLTQIQQTLGGLGRGEGTLSKVLNDPSLYNNLNETVVGVARVVARLEKVTQDFQVFADKVARNPEKIGLSGIVKPDTGLKEPPNVPLPNVPAPPVAPTQQHPGAGMAPIAPVPGGAGVPVYKPDPRR